MSPPRNILADSHEKMFLFEPNPNLELDEFLKNVRWKEQNEILVFVERLISQLLAGLPSKPIKNLTLKEKKDWFTKKAILLAIIDTKEFTTRIEQGEYGGWKSLLNQVKKIIES
jgi:hypothetical protein